MSAGSLTTAPLMSPFANFASADPSKAHAQAPKTKRAESLRSVVAGIVTDRGREVLYVGSERAREEIAIDPGTISTIRQENRFASRPMGPISAAAHATFQQLFAAGCEDLAVLGVMGLPEEVSSQMLRPESKGRFALILDGVNVTDPDVAFAVRGVRALADRTDTLLAVLPA